MVAPNTSTPQPLSSEQFVKRARKILQRGYFPIPVGRFDPKRGQYKFPWVTGYHGFGAKRANEDVISSWPAIVAKKIANGQRGILSLGIVMPDNVLAMDVDAYQGEHVGAKLEYWAEQFGPLPSTYRITARDDDSGIRLYRKPIDFYPKEIRSSGIDWIDQNHRFVMAPGSWHSHAVGKPYSLIIPTTGERKIWMPPVSELPEFPETYVNGLKSKPPTNRPGSLSDVEDRTIIDQFAAKYVGVEQSNAINWLVDREFKEPASLHDACRDALCWAARESKGGRYSWSEAVAKIRTRAVGAYRSRGDTFPADDFMRSQIHAVAEVANLSETELRERWQSRWQKSQQEKQKSTGSTDVSAPKAKRKVSDMPIEESLAKGQVRMATALCRDYGDKLIYVPEIGWYWWDKKRWQEDSLGKISQFVLAIIAKAMKIAGKRMQSGDHEDTVYGDKLWQDAESCQSAAGIDGIARIARTWRGFATPVKALDADPYTVNLQNLTLNLMTGETRNHDSADLITKIANAQYDSTAHCPQWIEYLSKVLPDAEVREFVQVLMGLALAGTQLEHILVIFKGNGRNGKGVFEDVMRHVLGDYAVSAASDLFTASPNAHTTSQTDLMGSRLAVIDETESDARLSEALLKKMTGGGTHTARRMRQNNIRFPMTWLPLMITNYLPRVTSQGADIWDRLVIVDFPTYFKPGEQDKFLREKLKTETDGIFMWAYEGWRKYQQDGYRMTFPDSVVQAGLDYRHSQDKLQMWIDQRCQIGHGDLFKTKPVVLLEDYNLWARSQDGAELMTKKQFLDLLRRKNFSYQTNRAVLVGVRLDPSRVDLSRENGGPVGVAHSGPVTSKTQSDQG